MMRRFFVRNLERLLNILVVLSALAVVALAVQTTIDASGDRRMLLQALAILLGGLTGILAVAGVAYLAISMNAHLSRMAAGSEKGERAPLTANRGRVAAAIAIADEPKEIRRTPRAATPLSAPAPAHAPAEPVAKKREPAPRIEPAPHRAEPSLARRPDPLPEPEPEPEIFEEADLADPQVDPSPEPVRPVFTGRGMPRLARDEPVLDKEKAQDEPAPSHPVFRGARLVADPRPKR